MGSTSKLIKNNANGKNIQSTYGESNTQPLAQKTNAQSTEPQQANSCLL